MEKDKVSVIMPNYNGSRFIADAIASVKGQTWQNWELIVIDDCSTDDSVRIITGFLADPRIKLLRLEKNVRVAQARNTGIREATGRYIAFLDSDDMWMQDKLEKQIAVLSSDEHAAIVYSDYSYMDETGAGMNRTIRVPQKVDYKQLLTTNTIGCLTAMYDTVKVGKLYFIEHGHEDYVLWLSILRQGFWARGVNEVLAQYRILASSYSANKLKAATWQWNIYRNVLKLNLFESVWYFVSYAYHGFRKHY